MKEVELFSSSDDFVINRICSILKERDIPFVKKESGAGSYMNIAFGKSPMTKKTIIISSENYSEAKELLDFLNVEEEKEEPTSNELKAIKVDEFGNRVYSLPAKILGWTTVVLFIAFVGFWVVQLVRYINRM